MTLKYTFEKYEKINGDSQWDVLRNKNHIVAECAIKADAKRISILLNHLEYLKNKEKEKKILKNLVIPTKLQDGNA